MPDPLQRCTSGRGGPSRPAIVGRLSHGATTNSIAARVWPVTSLVFVRHAQPQVGGMTPAARWPLTDKGRSDARVLGRHLVDRSATNVVWASPDRRARETAALAFPLVVIGVRDQLIEVRKPWYTSADQHSNAVANYLRGGVVEGWECRQDVMERITQLKADVRSVERLVLVTHGVLLTTWLDHEIGLHDPFSFWSNLRMPDAWEFDLEEKSLERIG